MKVIYSNEKVEKICEDLNKAKKHFGGNMPMAVSLMTRLNYLRQAETIKDVVLQPAFHFHKLMNKNGRNLEGYFAIDVKGRRDRWRIILEPLDENEEPYEPCNIDEVADKVRIVRIEEVSEHYE